MNTNHDLKNNLTNMGSTITQQISEHRGWYIFQGIAFVIAGGLAILLPSFTAIGFGLVIGALLLVSGGIQAVASIKSKFHWWSWVSALLSLVVGALMIINPVAGTVALATIVAIFLLLEGITELFLAFTLKPIKSWIWLLLSGLVSLVLALIVFAGWPGASLILLGVMIGINLIFYGLALLFITKAAKT